MSVAVVAQVIGAAIVSTAAGKIVTKVATKVTGSEKMGRALGIVAGVWAGSAAYGAMAGGGGANGAVAGAEGTGAGEAAIAKPGALPTGAETGAIQVPETARVNSLMSPPGGANVNEVANAARPLPPSGVAGPGAAGANAGAAVANAQTAGGLGVQANTAGALGNGLPNLPAPAGSVSAPVAPSGVDGVTNFGPRVDAPVPEAAKKWYEKDWFLSTAAGGVSGLSGGYMNARGEQDALDEARRIREANQYTGNVRFTQVPQPLMRGRVA